MPHYKISVSATIMRDLRESLNIPLENAAKKIRVKPDTLAIWEKDGAEISISKARTIASAYGRYWTILLLNELPEKKDLPKEYRKLKSSKGAYTTETLLAFRNAERILVLADIIGGRKTLKEELEKFSLDKFSNIKQTAASIRDWLGVCQAPN